MKTSGPVLDLLDPLLAALEAEHLSGVLTARANQVRKRILVLLGRIVMVESNDPRDLIGQALIRAGLIAETDLAAALAESEQLQEDPTSPRLLQILLAKKKITVEGSQAVFESKIRDAVLDLFLWDSGLVTLTWGVDAPSLATSMEISAIRVEGLKRRARWTAARKLIPDLNASFKRVKDWPDFFPRTPGDQTLARWIETGTSLARIAMEIHGNDYPIILRVAELVRTGVLQPLRASAFSKSDPPVSPPGPLSNPATGEFPPARPVPLAVAPASLEESPPDPDPSPEEIASLETERKLRAGGLGDDRLLRLSKPIDQLVRQELTPLQGFVISRMAAGSMRVGDLLSCSPVARVNLLQVLQQMLDLKLLAGVR